MTSESELKKVAEGREAEMFAWEDGKILRLLRDPSAHARNQRQAAAMEAARSKGVRVPAVMEVTTVLGRPGLVMERISGVDLLTLIGRQPWKVFWVGRVSGELHAQLHDVKAPDGIPPLKEFIRERIESRERVPKHLAQFALEVLERLPEGDKLCHGDFHPGNIMMAGDEPVLIDWTIPARGDPLGDVARTRLMLRLGEPPPGTSAPLRVMALVGRNILLWRYLRSYDRVRRLNMGLVARWEIPVAAARMAAGIDSEYAALMRFLERARASL